MGQLTENKETKDLAAASQGWGQDTNVTSQDIVIPKILPLQYMSEKVKNNEGKYGEFRDTLNNQLFGDLETPFEVVPIAMEKKWIEFDVVTSKSGQRKREFKQVIPIQDNPTLDTYNDELPLVEDTLERDRIMDFYVLIPSEIEEGGAMPYVLSFRRTSLKAGKKLATQMFVKNRMANKPPASTVMLVSGTNRQNDDGEFVVQDVKVARPVTDEELKAAYEWFQMIKSGKTKVDESDVQGEREVTSRDVQEERF